MALHTATGLRKYLTADERDAFLLVADVANRQVRPCATLAYARCRLSEALALTADRVDLAAGVLTIESLKMRRTGIYRAVPVPPALLETLDMVHGIRVIQSRRGKSRSERLFDQPIVFRCDAGPRPVNTNRVNLISFGRSSGGGTPEPDRRTRPG